MTKQEILKSILNLEQSKLKNINRQRLKVWKTYEDLIFDSDDIDLIRSTSWELDNLIDKKYETEKNIKRLTKMAEKMAGVN